MNLFTNLHNLNLSTYILQIILQIIYKLQIIIKFVYLYFI